MKLLKYLSCMLHREKNTSLINWGLEVKIMYVYKIIEIPFMF